MAVNQSGSKTGCSQADVTNHGPQTDVTSPCPSFAQEQLEPSVTDCADGALEEQVQALEIVGANVPANDLMIAANTPAASLTSSPCPVSDDASSVLSLSHALCLVPEPSAAVHLDSPAAHSQCTPVLASADLQKPVSSRRKSKNKSSSKKTGATPPSGSNTNQCMYCLLCH